MTLKVGDVVQIRSEEELLDMLSKDYKIGDFAIVPEMLMYAGFVAMIEIVTPNGNYMLKDIGYYWCDAMLVPIDVEGE